MAKKKKSVKKGLIIGISSVVVLLAAAYAGVGYYFHDHFYPGTVINETNFSLGTVEAAEAKIICWLSTTEKTGSLISVDRILIIIMNQMAASRR